MKGDGWTAAWILAVLVGVTAAAVTSEQSMNRATVQDLNSIRPCPEEDGGPTLPCRWDAQRSGNGEGESFTVYPRKGGGQITVYDNGTLVEFDETGEKVQP